MIELPITVRLITTGKLALACIALACGASTAYGANLRPGEPVSNFGKAGLATANLATAKHGVRSNLAADAAIDSKGRILIAGARRSKSYESAVLAFGVNGKLDASWGNRGRIIHRFGWRGQYTNRNIYASEIAIGPRERVYTTDVVNLVTERDWRRLSKLQEGDPEPEELDLTRSNFFIYAHTSSGRPIRSFGQNGRARVRGPAPKGYQDGARSLFDMQVAGDGSIFLLYSDTGFSFRVEKLRSDGTVDASFGKRGRKSIPMANDYDITEMASANLHVTGSKLLITYAVNDQQDQGNGVRVVWVATRLKASGAIDGQYGVRGRAKYVWPRVSTIPETERGFYSTRDRRGNLILAGTAFVSEDDDTAEAPIGAVVRLTPKGKLDRSFGQGGTYRPTDAMGSPQYVYGVAATDDGKYAIGTLSCGDDACGPFSSRLLSASGRPETDWSGASFTSSMGRVQDIVGMYAKGKRVYQVPASLRPRGAQHERFALLALSR